jgi:hypothetical protein
MHVCSPFYRSIYNPTHQQSSEKVAVERPTERKFRYDAQNRPPSAIRIRLVAIALGKCFCRCPANLQHSDCDSLARSSFPFPFRFPSSRGNTRVVTAHNSPQACHRGKQRPLAADPGRSSTKAPLRCPKPSPADPAVAGRAAAFFCDGSRGSLFDAIGGSSAEPGLGCGNTRRLGLARRSARRSWGRCKVNDLRRARLGAKAIGFDFAALAGWRAAHAIAHHTPRNRWFA